MTALAALGVARRDAQAVGTRIPTTSAARRLAPAAFIPATPDPSTFQRLALVAMDAARAAGAEMADIRIGMQRQVIVSTRPEVQFEIGYGVRARVRGTWGFEYGTTLSNDAVARVARSAVRGAQRYAETNTALGLAPDGELAPRPVVTGEWRVPVEIDPFTVPIDDYYRVIGALAEDLARIHRNRQIESGTLVWTAETRVFASTDGSLVTQYFMRGGHNGRGDATLPAVTMDRVSIDIPTRREQSGGFELVLVPTTTDTLLARMEEATRLRELPLRPFLDVGRFPVVFDGTAFGSVIGETVGLAMDAERVAGLEADASGTSFLSPIGEIVHAARPSFSSLLTIRSDRALPSTLAAQWDDEGVTPTPYTIIDHGKVVDYHTTRETVGLLASWYAERGVPLQAHGTAIAPSCTSVPVCGTGHLRVAPDSRTSAAASVYELAKDMQHGFILRGGRADASESLSLATLDGSMAIEVQRGKPIARTGVLLQFPTIPLLREKLVTLGGTPTERTVPAWTPKGMPWEWVTQEVTAPAALCKDVDVVSWAFRT